MPYYFRNGSSNLTLESRHADEKYTLTPEETWSVVSRSLNKMPVKVEHSTKVVEAY